jgi:transcriptional regulator with XRE-family HTH domain
MELIRYEKELVLKLKERRIKLRMSQAALAQKLGTLQPAVARMEAGQIGQVSLDFLAKAAMILGVAVSIKVSLKAA